MITDLYTSQEIWDAIMKFALNIFLLRYSIRVYGMIFLIIGTPIAIWVGNVRRKRRNKKTQRKGEGK